MSGNYCQKISSEEFEMQRDVMSEVALSELMESIMRDESMSERDKLKWIKQVSWHLPVIYCRQSHCNLTPAISIFSGSLNCIIPKFTTSTSPIAAPKWAPNVPHRGVARHELALWGRPFCRIVNSWNASFRYDFKEQASDLGWRKDTRCYPIQSSQW